MTTGLADLTLGNLSIEDIVSGYDTIETEIQNLAYLRFLEDLGDPNQFGSNPILIDGNSYQISFEVMERSRSLHIGILPIDYTRSAFTKTEKQFSTAGIVSRITVRHNKRIRRRVEKALLNLANGIFRDYRVLEKRFVEKSSEIPGEIFEGIDHILQTQFEMMHRERLVDECRLSLTPLETGNYYHFINRTQLSFIISKFKSRADLDYSPIRHAIAIISEDGNDLFLKLGVLSGAQFSEIPLSDIRATHSNEKLINAEAYLSKDNSMSCIEVVRSNELSLQVTVATKYAQDVVQAIVAAKQFLQPQLERNLQTVSDRKKLIRKMGRLNRGRLWEETKDILTSLGAKIAVEASK